MSRNKKGAAAAHSHSKREQNMITPYDYSHYFNAIECVCLLLFIVSIVLMYIGAYVKINEITILGLGLGGAAGLIQVKINTQEE